MVLNVNKAPVADAGSNQTVDEGDLVILDASASSDPDGDALSFTWMQTSGPSAALISASSPMASFTAPETSVDVDLGFRVIATDAHGASTNADGIVRVTNVNKAPIANPGLDRTVDEGVAVVLNASMSSDPDGGALAFQWTQTSGPPVMLANSGSSTANFTAPSVAIDTELVFDLTVTDSQALSDTAAVAITIHNLDAALATIQLNKASLTPAFRLGNPAPNLSFTVRNVGGGTLRYGISVATQNGGAWLSVQPTMSTATTETDTIAVTIIPASLGVGDYLGTITVSDPAATTPSESVSVYLTVLDSSVFVPTIDVSTSMVVIDGSGSGGADPESNLYLTIRNSGDDALDYTIESNQPWLTVNPSSGSVGSVGQAIMFSFPNAGMLPVGQHMASLTISDPMATNSPQVVHVMMRHDVNYAGRLLTGSQLNDPYRISVDSQNRLYVASRLQNVIRRCDSNGANVFTFGSGTAGTADGQLNLPQAAAADANGTVYVCDTANNRIQVFDSNGTFLFKWGVAGTGVRQFNVPNDIALDSGGAVYVADANNNRIQKFAANGDFERQWTVGLNGLFVDSQDRVFVLDSLLIKEFTPFGALVRSISIGRVGRDLHVTGDDTFIVLHDGPSYVTVYDANGMKTKGWSRNGNGNGQFVFLPLGIAMDSGASVYVSGTSGGGYAVVKWSP